MQKVVFNLFFIMQSLTLLAAASSEHPSTLIATQTYVPFDTNEKHLEQCYRITRTLATNPSVEENTKNLFNTISNSIFWISNQNKSTTIKTTKFRPITAPLTTCDLYVRAKQHLEHGIRQAQEARKATSPTKPENVVVTKLHDSIKIVMQRSFEMLKDLAPSIEETSFQENLNYIKAYATSGNELIKKNRYAESPTKKEKRGIQLLTKFLTPVPFDTNAKPENFNTSSSSSSCSSSSLIDMTADESSSLLPQPEDQNTSSSSSSLIDTTATESSCALSRSRSKITVLFNPAPFNAETEFTEWRNRSNTGSPASTFSSLLGKKPSKKNLSSSKKNTTSLPRKKRSAPTPGKKINSKKPVTSNNSLITSLFKSTYPNTIQETPETVIEILTESDEDTPDDYTDEPVTKRQRHLRD